MPGLRLLVLKSAAPHPASPPSKGERRSGKVLSGIFDMDVYGSLII